MKNPGFSVILIILFILISGCSQVEDDISPGQKYSQKTIQLQESIIDYSVTVEEQLQNGGPAIVRNIVIKRPYMYRITDSADCYDLSNGTVLSSYCNGSDTLNYFADPSVRQFIADVDYQKIFTQMISEGDGTFEGTETLENTSTWIIEIKPIRNRYHIRYDFITVRMWIDNKTGMILRAEMLPENTTNVGIVQFHNVTVNRGISDDMFTYTPVSGMNVVDRKAGLFKENLEGNAGYTHNATPCTNCPMPSRTPRL